MLYYRDGNEARTGDRVDYDGELSVVEDLVDTEEKRLEWKVNYLGLLLTNVTFGRVYVEVDDVLFLGRGKQ